MKRLLSACGALALLLSAVPAAAQGPIPGLMYVGAASPPGRCPAGTVYAYPVYDSRGKLLMTQCYMRAPAPNPPPGGNQKPQ